MRFRFKRKQEHHDSMIEDVTPAAQLRRWRINGSSNRPLTISQRSAEAVEDVVERYVHWQALQPQDTIARRLQEQQTQSMDAT